MPPVMEYWHKFSNGHHSVLAKGKGMSINSELLCSLKGCRDKRNRASDEGICAAVLEGSRLFTSSRVMRSITLKALFSKWPKYSGAPAFPIPNPEKGSLRQFGRSDLAALEAYDNSRLDFNMWDRRTKYGKLRFELLEWCIAELEKEMSHE